MNSETRPQQEQQTASQRFAALVGLPAGEPTEEQRAEFVAWFADGNAAHAAWIAARAGAPHAA